ncbi:hypothetical protein BATDEDRAFT_88764 [Batrachochytrium dendrobatidis JAM81]|uniref:Uncharacterized protein n=1 Tax=Batrachochytrium dendrobatidis (strain JAM81 / FGSC 10211) TaxID=684364 RepID=F4P3H4_BATDJ|nr:uncharacterized protein BATDEDRAFT_88764 [Batrachochytrium dendrobatidis JAM81]EGF80468.1 hypothetical protein BATDEDRAFT_88764 [Batrachochytrium dendrobatidis JAM81]|eukprot:XP_006679295.1 hypothetical protein BATDEDRAFT_88764 [Batrachochytrium dendrobatidis JAM81]
MTGQLSLQDSAAPKRNSLITSFFKPAAIIDLTYSDPDSEPAILIQDKSKCDSVLNSTQSWTTIRPTRSNQSSTKHTSGIPVVNRSSTTIKSSSNTKIAAISTQCPDDLTDPFAAPAKSAKMASKSQSTLLKSTSTTATSRSQSIFTRNTINTRSKANQTTLGQQSKKLHSSIQHPSKLPILSKSLVDEITTASQTTTAFSKKQPVTEQHALPKSKMTLATKNKPVSSANHLNESTKDLANRLNQIHHSDLLVETDSAKPSKTLVHARKSQENTIPNSLKSMGSRKRVAITVQLPAKYPSFQVQKTASSPTINDLELSSVQNVSQTCSFHGESDHSSLTSHSPKSSNSNLFLEKSSHDSPDTVTSKTLSASTDTNTVGDVPFLKSVSADMSDPQYPTLDQNESTDTDDDDLLGSVSSVKNLPKRKTHVKLDESDNTPSGQAEGSNEANLPVASSSESLTIHSLSNFSSKALHIIEDTSLEFNPDPIDDADYLPKLNGVVPVASRITRSAVFKSTGAHVHSPLLFDKKEMTSSQYDLFSKKQLQKSMASINDLDALINQQLHRKNTNSKYVSMSWQLLSKNTTKDSNVESSTDITNETFNHDIKHMDYNSDEEIDTTTSKISKLANAVPVLPPREDALLISLFEANSLLEQNLFLKLQTLLAGVNLDGLTLNEAFWFVTDMRIFHIKPLRVALPSSWIEILKSLGMPCAFNESYDTSFHVASYVEYVPLDERGKTRHPPRAFISQEHSIRCVLKSMAYIVESGFLKISLKQRQKWINCIVIATLDCRSSPFYKEASALFHHLVATCPRSELKKLCIFFDLMGSSIVSSENGKEQSLSTISSSLLHQPSVKYTGFIQAIQCLSFMSMNSFSELKVLWILQNFGLQLLDRILNRHESRGTFEYTDSVESFTDGMKEALNILHQDSLFSKTCTDFTRLACASRILGYVVVGRTVISTHLDFASDFAKTVRVLHNNITDSRAISLERTKAKHELLHLSTWIRLVIDACSTERQHNIRDYFSSK